jgi:hypothetical protein
MRFAAFLLMACVVPLAACKQQPEVKAKDDSVAVVAK